MILTTPSTRRGIPKKRLLLRRPVVVDRPFSYRLAFFGPNL